MNAQTLGWFTFLALIKSNFCHGQLPVFKLPDSNLTATEGSCAEIKCKVNFEVDDTGALWFWMKNAIWLDDKRDFNATIIYSTNSSSRPVSPDFAGRVTYIGSPPSNWGQHSSSQRLCNILICNLSKHDSGNYSFRFVGKNRREVTKPPSALTVQDNPCPITFETPPAVKENGKITITCSTLKSCPSNLQILTQLPETRLSWSSPTDKQKKSTTVSFTASPQDDGSEFSCQTQKNTDPYLIRNISITVEYAPKDIQVENPPTHIKEGDDVTLTCSAKGRPVPTFTWLKNGESQASEAKWTIQSINESQSGDYWCEARNDHGNMTSRPVSIDVTYVPEVEIIMTPPTSTVKQGDKITLTCNVTRSNPKPGSYVWLKNGGDVYWEQTYVLEGVEPKDKGSYTCRATNAVGPGNSEPLTITVEYGPRSTNIFSENGLQVRADYPLRLRCDTDANPTPTEYSWYRDKKQIDSSQWTSKTTNGTDGNYLYLDRVQRTDEACYRCNATNTINTGENSESVCITVLYGPTNLKLSMDAEVTEGQLITISCTVESNPVSHLELKLSSAIQLPQPLSYGPPNTLQYKFNVTSAHTGSYTCTASNSQSFDKTKERKLVVKYLPKDVKVEAEPGLIVNESTSLTLRCSFHSHPKVTSVTWVKKTDGKSENLNTIERKAVSPSDSGLYSCTATNDIGTGFSEQAEVKVKYGPKHTKITRAEEQPQSNGRSSVTLSCSSLSYPPVTEYSWYKKTEANSRDEKVSSRQSYTVFSDEPGIYYCIAKNEMGHRSSDPVPLFLDRALRMTLRIFFICLISLLIVGLLIFVYRHKRKKSTQQGTANTSPCFGFLGWWICARRKTLRTQPVMAEPFRSRDDLLPDQPSHPNGQRRQPRPDSTPASNINSVYCTVNLPAGEQGPSARKKIRQQRGHTEDESLNYASVQFKNKKQNKHTNAEENIVYAIVTKKKQQKKNGEEKLPDYENVSAAHAAKPPNSSDSDSETSEDDEVEVNYSQVSFKAKSGHQKARTRVSRDSSSETSSDSSTSDEEETQYSVVKT